MFQGSGDEASILSLVEGLLPASPPRAGKAGDSQNLKWEMGFVAKKVGPPAQRPSSEAYEAAIVVFFVGFALGLSVFVASRLFVRSILSKAMPSPPQRGLVTQFAEGKSIVTSGALAPIDVRATLTLTRTAGRLPACSPARSPAKPAVLRTRDIEDLGGRQRPAPSAE